MKKFSYLFLVLALGSCSSNKLIIYKPEKESKGFSIEVPKKYKINFLIGNTYEYKFYNKNGIEIFIGEEISINPERKLSYNKDSIEVHKLLVKSIAPSDTVIKQGILDSLYWKSLEINYRTSLLILSIKASYKNVPENQRYVFDKYLFSIEPLKNDNIEVDPLMIRYLKNQKNNNREK